MTVWVQLANGKTFGNRKEEPASAYFVTESGCLQALTLGEDLKWFISMEFSPSAWMTVEGTRFTASTKNLAGSKGTDTLRFSGSAQVLPQALS